RRRPGAARNPPRPRGPRGLGARRVRLGGHRRRRDRPGPADDRRRPRTRRKALPVRLRPLLLGRPAVIPSPEFITTKPRTVALRLAPARALSRKRLSQRKRA